MTALKQLGQTLTDYLEMPTIEPPPLPQAWLGHLGLRPWPLASVIVGFSLYLPLFILIVVNNPDGWFTNHWWQYSLLYPIMTVYLLLMVPVFIHLLDKTTAPFLPLLSPAKIDEQRKLDGRMLNRSREWTVFGLGVLGGWLITPFGAFGNIWQTLYVLLGEGINIGLLGWLTYFIGLGTKRLTALHNQTQALNIPSVSLFAPLNRWGLGMFLAFIGGSLISILLIPQQELLSPKNIIIYSVLNLLILLVFLRNSESASLLAQFRILRAFSLFVLVALAGTLGYHYLEGWNTLDGLYMTIITMTTIGYGEIGPLGARGRIFTIILGLVSVGVAGYALSVVAAFIFEGDFQRAIRGQKMNKEIAKLADHFILCGAGHIGEQIALELKKTRRPFLLIDQSQEAIEAILRLGEIPYLLGDATKDETLHLAGIQRAKGLVANLGDDKDNAFVVLSARSLNPELRIVARLTDAENAGKLRKVGADEIVSPSVIGGLRMASVMVRPQVVTFLDEMMRVSDQTLRLEEITLTAHSALADQTLAQANIGQRTGLLIVAIKAPDGSYKFNPQGDVSLQIHDTLIVIGEPDQLTRLNKLDGGH